MDDNSKPQAGIHTGVVAIDPPHAVALFGYAARRAVAKPKDACLEANWAAYPTDEGIGLLISIDTLFSSKLFENELRLMLKDRGVRLTALDVIASHTHFAPSLDPEKPMLGSLDRGYLNYVVEILATSVAQIILTPATEPSSLRHGSAPAAGAVFRRAKGIKVRLKPPFLQAGIHILPEPAVAIPKSCRVWVFETKEADCILAIASWPCHPVGRSNAAELSADYLTALRQGVREVVGASVPVIFLPGASGDIRPLFAPAIASLKRLYPFPFQRCFGSATLAQEAEFDNQVAKAVKDAVLTSIPIPIRDRVTVCKSAVACSKFTVGSHADDEMGLSAIDFFGLVILGLGAEISTKWHSILKIDPESENKVLTGYLGAVFGYLPTDEQIPEGGYEVDGFRLPFGFKGKYVTSQKVNRVIRRACGAVLEYIDVKQV